MPNYIFDGTEGDMITPENANIFRQTYESSPNFAVNQGVKGHFFGRNILEELLSQTGAKGLRIYYGLKPINGAPSEPQLVIIATDHNGDDILDDDKIADASKPCPPLCGN